MLPWFRIILHEFWGKDKTPYSWIVRKSLWIKDFFMKVFQTFDNSLRWVFLRYSTLPMNLSKIIYIELFMIIEWRNYYLESYFNDSLYDYLITSWCFPKNYYVMSFVLELWVLKVLKYETLWCNILIIYHQYFDMIYVSHECKTMIHVI